jgi:hypothetical protein
MPATGAHRGNPGQCCRKVIKTTPKLRHADAPNQACGRAKTQAFGHAKPGHSGTRNLGRKNYR